MTPRAPRISRAAALLAAGLATLIIAGCGGADVEYQEVPGEPAEITLPEGGDAAAGDAAAREEEAAPEDGAAGEATPTPEPTPEPQVQSDSGAAGGGETTADSDTGDVTAEDGPDNDVPPEPGSDAQRFEDFCEQNAGAC